MEGGGNTQRWRPKSQTSYVCGITCGPATHTHAPLRNNYNQDHNYDQDHWKSGERVKDKAGAAGRASGRGRGWAQAQAQAHVRAQAQAHV